MLIRWTVSNEIFKNVKILEIYLLDFLLVIVKTIKCTKMFTIVLKSTEMDQKN